MALAKTLSSVSNRREGNGRHEENEKWDGWADIVAVFQNWQEGKETSTGRQIKWKNRHHSFHLLSSLWSGDVGRLGVE